MKPKSEQMTEALESMIARDYPHFVDLTYHGFIKIYVCKESAQLLYNEIKHECDFIREVSFK